MRKAKAQETGVDPVDILATADLKAISRLAFTGGDPLGPLSLLKRSRYGPPPTTPSRSLRHRRD